jgi:hypothetical protein
MGKHTHLNKKAVVAIFLIMGENKTKAPLQSIFKTQIQNMKCNNNHVPQ